LYNNSGLVTYLKHENPYFSSACRPWDKTKMKITESDLRDIILEELKTIANSKHPSDVEMVEDDTGGGALSDDFEHVPEDVPADSEKPQARVQRKEPLVRERQYSLRSLLEQDSPKPSKDQLAKKWAAWLKSLNVRQDEEGDRSAFLLRMVDVLGPEPKNAAQAADLAIKLQIQDDMGMNNTGYNLDDLVSALGSLREKIKYTTKVDFTDDAVGGRDEAMDEAVNEARFMGGMGFGAPTLSEDLDEGHCGCGSPDMLIPHRPADHEHDVRDLDHSDDEGSMALSQLRRSAKYSQKLGDMIRESDDLPEWVESKITKASDYLGSVYHYLDYELNGKK